MNISYPIRDKDGNVFRSLEEIMRLVDGEAHGTWLPGENGLWHGAVHLSEVSNPFSALTPDTLSSGKPVPLQFMADGTIAAYRINSDYLKAPWKGQELRYSSTFVLVKSRCQPDPQKQESWLEFYSLYMHLAPVKDYPSSSCYRVRDGHSGIRLRQYREEEYGLPDGQESGDTRLYQAPPAAGKNLGAGDRVVLSRTGRFYVTKNNGATLTTFGLVHLLKDGKTEDKPYWVTLDPELMEPDGEIQALMPAWMQKAKARGLFNQVQTGGETEEWRVSAGTPVGFMGCEYYPGSEGGQAEREWFVHLEILSTDPGMPAFDSVSRVAEQGDEWYEQVPPFYQALMAAVDSNGDGEVTEEEIRQPLVVVRDPLVGNMVNRLVVRHHSEWYGGRTTRHWERFYKHLDTEEVAYCKKWQTDLEWMSEVSPFNNDEPVWHFHPILFLDAITPSDTGITYEQLKSVFSQASGEDLNAVVEELRGKLTVFKLDTPTRLRHFFSQIKGEVGAQMKGRTESFQFSPATLRSFSSYYRANPSESEEDGYEKNSAGRIIRRANEQAIGRKHYLRLNGNRQSHPDDGYNFRGRGLIQITGYEKYHGFLTEYHNYWSDPVPDTVNHPEKINEMPYAIRSALWFWIKYKVYNADTGRGYDDVANVTRIVNGANMGLTERREAYVLCEQVFL